MRLKAGRRIQPSRRIPRPPVANCQPTSTAQSLFPWRRLNLGPSLIGIPVARLSKIGPSAGSIAYEKQGVSSSIVIPQGPFLSSRTSVLCTLLLTSFYTSYITKPLDLSLEHSVIYVEIYPFGGARNFR